MARRRCSARNRVVEEAANTGNRSSLLSAPAASCEYFWIPMSQSMSKILNLFLKIMRVILLKYIYK